MLWRQVQKEAVAKEYANARYQQPYQTAMYETAVLLEAQRWHTHEYEAVIGKLQPGDLTVGDPLSLPSLQGQISCGFGARNASEISDVLVTPAPLWSASKTGHILSVLGRPLSDLAAICALHAMDA